MLLWPEKSSASFYWPLAAAAPPLMLATSRRLVLAQREMEKRRSVSVDSAPGGRGFSRHRGLSSDDFLWLSVCSAKTLAPALLNIGSMSPPGYPSAWLPPGRARLRFTWQVHCSSATPCCFQVPVCPSPDRVVAVQFDERPTSSGSRFI